MAFKRLLVLLRSYPAATPVDAVKKAVDVAVALDARISALACAVFPRMPGSILGGLVAVPSLVGESHRKIAGDTQQLLQSFAGVARDRGVLGQEIYKECEPDALPPLLSAHARLADLTIMPMPTGGYVEQLDSHWYAETALFESGHPVLILPQDERPSRPIAFDTVIVAWDNTRAAARAIADAMPILQRAKSVRVVTVANEKTLVADPASAEIVTHLAAHDVQAVHETVDAAGRDAGAVLADCMRGRSADLLVMGGYGHSRMREFMLGGATRSMLTHPPGLVFLSH